MRLERRDGWFFAAVTVWGVFSWTMFARNLGAAYAAGERPAPPTRPGVLAAIPRMRFVRPVFPGDQLRLHTQHVKSLGGTHWVRAEGRVNGEVVATGELILSS